MNVQGDAGRVRAQHLCSTLIWEGDGWHGAMATHAAHVPDDVSSLTARQAPVFVAKRQDAGRSQPQQFAMIGRSRQHCMTAGLGRSRGAVQSGSGFCFGVGLEAGSGGVTN